MHYLKQASKTVTSKIQSVEMPKKVITALKGYVSSDKNVSETEKLFKSLVKSQK